MLCHLGDTLVLGTLHQELGTQTKYFYTAVTLVIPSARKAVIFYYDAKNLVIHFPKAIA